MKHLITINNLNDIKKAACFDGFLFGLQGLSKGFHTCFKTTQINLLIKSAKEYGKKIFLVLDDLYKDSDFINLEKALISFDYFLLDGILISDLGLISFFKDKKFVPLIINTPALIMSVSDFNHFAKTPLQGGVISNQLPLDAQLTIIKKAKMTTFIHAYGYNPIMNTIRPLVSNYYQHYKIKNNFDHTFLTLEEQKRPGKYYPIFENERGCLVFDSKIINRLAQRKTYQRTNYFIYNTLYLNLEEVITLFKEQNGTTSTH